MAEQQTPAQRLLGDFAPKMVQLTDDVLFGDVWKRPGLSPRDRSLVTVAVLAATYRPDQLASHLRRALANGLTQDELVEALTHLAFYAGWPSGMAALTQLKTITAEAGSGASTPAEARQAFDLAGQRCAASRAAGRSRESDYQIKWPHEDHDRNRGITALLRSARCRRAR